MVETQGGRDETVRGAGLRKNQSPHQETYKGLWADVFIGLGVAPRQPAKTAREGNKP